MYIGTGDVLRVRLPVFTDVETTFDLTAFYNVFQGCTHNRITFSRFYVKKIDAEIEFTVQTDACSFLDVL